jgi:hypothetical protein
MSFYERFLDVSKEGKSMSVNAIVPSLTQSTMISTPQDVRKRHAKSIRIQDVVLPNGRWAVLPFCKGAGSLIVTVVRVKGGVH